MNEQLQHAVERTQEVGQQWSNEAQNALAERILEEIEEIEWEKLLASSESVAYWAKRSKEIREEHKAGKTIEWRPGESFEALFQ